MKKRIARRALGPCSLALLLAVSLGSLSRAAAQDTTDTLPGNPRAVTVEGVRLHYVDKGQGTPMVLVHGTLQDYTAWLPSLDIFSEHHRVLAYSRRYDWPNENAWDEGDYSARVDARDLAALIEHLELGPVHLVGHSYGGLVALLLAIERPDLIRTLVLSEPPLAPEPFGLSALPGLARYPEYAEMLRLGRERETVQSFIGEVLGPEMIAQVPEAMWDQILLDVEEFRALVNSADPFPAVSREELVGVERPTLTVIGERTKGTLFESFTDTLVQHISGAEAVTIPNASHALWFENAEQTHEAVLDFVERWSGR